MDLPIYSIDDKKQLERAGTTDLIRLLPAPGQHQLFIPKGILQTLAYSIAAHEFIHISGPTGTAKTSLIEALCMEPKNFRALCESLGFEAREIRMYPIEMVTYELPGELFFRRALKDGQTVDEPSGLVRALKKAAKHPERCNLIWLREIGRVHTSAVQGGLLNLMTKSMLNLPSGECLDLTKVGWVADSNYQAVNDDQHTLVPFDDALRRRFSVNLTLDYLPPEQEVAVLQQLTMQGNPEAKSDQVEALCETAVTLGTALRVLRRQGKMLTATPPTIYGALAFIRMALSMPQRSLRDVASVTLLGNCDSEDRKLGEGLLSDVLLSGTHAGQDPTQSENLL